MTKLIFTALSTCLLISITLVDHTDDNNTHQKKKPSPPNAVRAESSAQTKENQKDKSKKGTKMEFGNFSVSLAVKDLKASKAFYEKLDFKQTFGSMEQNYLIMQNETSTIGLFQGMFEKNILTFNPGWDRNAKTLEKFQDVRELQATLKERGIKPVSEAKEGDGPASFVVVDPDGNAILVDQHVPKPK